MSAQDDDPTLALMEQLSSTGLRQRIKNAPQDPSSIAHTYRPVQKTLERDGGGSSKPHVEFLEPVNQSKTETPIDASYVESLMGGMRPTEESRAHDIAISTIDTYFRYFTAWLFGTWLTLVVLMYVLVPSENIVPLSGLEQRAAFTSMSLIFVSFLSRVIPLFGISKMKRNEGRFGVDALADGESRGLRKVWDNVTRNMSGLLLGGLSIQVVAFMTDFFMAFFPVPVVMDPVLGTRVHVLRWCEWYPCATFMTFMMEGADLFWPEDVGVDNRQNAQQNIQDGPPPDFFKKKFMHAAAQGGAVFLGLLFPFCPGFKTWICAMTISCTLYLTNYPRMIQRRNEIPQTLRKGATVEEAERYNSAITALKLRYICIAVWSIIVLLYFVSSVGPMFVSENSILRNPAANMCCECFFDVLSKVLFLVTIIDVHRAIFDPFARSQRRLEELRKLMAAVWESSSDPIAISVRTGPKGEITTLLSPAFFALGGGKGALRRLSKDEIKDLFCNKSVLFKLSGNVFNRASSNANDNCEVKPGDILSVKYTGFSTGMGITSGIIFAGQTVTPEMGVLNAVAESVVKAWLNDSRDPVFSHELTWKSENRKDMLIHSEAKVSRLDENSLIVIIRDISERVKIFETEKKILLEATSRQKDAEANRFTRHEVKNGLLAAIGLYETLCEAQKSHILKDTIDDSGFGLGESDDSANVVRCMNELGKSLHETLDTILVEAMTRDLIHDVYRPHRERIDVATAISGFADSYAYNLGSIGNLRRFPLITRPSPLPRFYLDPNLLRYLHRQVLSNACKYGKIGGDILTEIIYNDRENRLVINVINLPGEFHDQLVAMGDAAEGAVFRKGAQIHETMIVDTASTIASSVRKAEMAAHPGDGGWIIQKCATVMKGQCSMKFEETKTVFALEIPAKPWGTTKVKTSIDVKTFRLPPGTWGFCIDDSKIQQKLMVKFFEYAGIPSSKICIFGRDSEEIMSFVDHVVTFMGEHMGDQILLIADENLDIVDEAAKHKTVSGSHLVEAIRARLLPEQERCLLSLIRSANDSASDIAIYKSRAHGFLPKAPIKKANVLETLAPLWFARYPPTTTREDDETEGSQRRRSDSFSSLESSLSLHEAVASTPLDILLVVGEIDKLFAQPTDDTFFLVREKLHALKGDLLTMKVGSKVMAVVGAIDLFRDNFSDDKLLESWHLLREQITSLASQ